MNRVNDKTGFYAWILFLIWPLLATASAFRNFDQKWAKNVFWAFCAFYGFAFAIGSESQGSDIVRYVASYQSLHGVEVNLISYIQESQRADYFSNVIAIILSRFTDSQPMLTLVYGIIFGFFFSRNIWYILERLEGKLLPVTIILLICFFLVNPIWRINGVRMWTATHIFLYGLLPFLCEGKKKGVLISAASILVHFSFILPVTVLMAYVFLGNRLTIYYAFFISTFFIAEIDITTFNEYVERFLPEPFVDRSESYRREGAVEQYREAEMEGRWYANWYRPALGYAIMGFLSILYFRSRTFFDDNRVWMNLFCFTLLFYGVASLMSSIPSGQRFLILANLCALALIILYLQNQPRERFMQQYIYITLPLLLLFIIVSIRTGLYFTGATTVLGNPIIAILTAGSDISLNDVMRMIL